MNQVNEPVKTRAFSIIETLLISAIIQNLYNSDQQVTIDEIDTLKIHSAYISIRKVAEALNLQLRLFFVGAYYPDFTVGKFTSILGL